MRGRDVDKRLFTARTLGLDTPRFKGHTGVQSRSARYSRGYWRKLSGNLPGIFHGVDGKPCVNVRLACPREFTIGVRPCTMRGRFFAARLLDLLVPK